MIFRRINHRQIDEAVMVGASKCPEGTQAIEWNTVCPDAGFEWLKVVRRACRVCVALDRPERGALRCVQMVMETEVPPQPGEKVTVEFFPPGEPVRQLTAKRLRIRWRRPSGWNGNAPLACTNESNLNALDPPNGALRSAMNCLLTVNQGAYANHFAWKLFWKLPAQPERFWP